MRRLRYFVAVADAKSLSLAAKNLFVSQPTLSVAMQKLSHDLGATLFSPTGYELTEAGQELYEVGSQILRDVQLLEDRIRRIEQRSVLELRVGFTHLFALRFMEKTLAFMARHTDVKFSMEQHGSKELQRLVAAGELDIAVVSFPQYESGLEMMPLKPSHDYEVAAVMCPKHPLSGRDSLTWADLAGCSFSSLGDHYVLHHLLSEQGQKAGFKPNVVFQNDNEEILINSVERLNSVCLMPLEVKNSYPSHDVRWVPLRDQGSTIPVGLATRAAQPLAPQLRELAQLLQS